MTPYIQKLKSFLTAGNIEAAQNVLTDVETRSETDMQAVIELLALAKDKDAPALISFLLNRIDSKHPFHKRLFQLATDRAHLNYAFAEILLKYADKNQQNQIIPLLRHILSREVKGDQLNRLIRTIGKLKMVDLVDDLAEFIFYDDPELKREAVKALKRMGSEKALERLEQVAQTEKCDMDILDAVDSLRDTLALTRPPHTDPPPVTKWVDPQTNEGISPSHLTAPDLAQRAAAHVYYASRTDQVAQLLKKHLDTKDQDLMVHLLRLTAKTIPQQALGDLLTLADQKDLPGPIKFSLYTALSRFSKIESAAVILRSVTDPSMYIRMAAVKLLDRHCSDYIKAEIKKKIEFGTKIGESLGQTILDAGAINLINALMGSDSFSYIAANYIERGAPINVIDTYMQVLESRGRRSSVKKYARIKSERADNQTPWLAVISPDETLLAVYAKLIHGCGFRAHSFNTAVTAFEFPLSDPPAAVICDLFIDQNTALDIAKKIRKHNSLDDVPIMVSALERHLDEKMMGQMFKSVGINGYCPFPAKPSQIKSWVASA